MGASSSKAARTLSKSTPSSSPASAAANAAARAGPSSSSSSRPPSARSQPSPPSSRPPPSEIPVDSQTLGSADAIGQTGRQASPLQRDDRIGPVPGRSEGGSETKNAAVRRDAFDPDFVTQLNNLGPVQVPHASNRNAASQQQPSQMTRILQARQEREARLEAEREAAKSTSTTRPGPPGALPHSSLDVSTLTMLLDERKSCRSPSDLARLAREYDVPLGLLEGAGALTRRFNSPSIGRVMDSPEEQRRKREGSDTTPTRMLAVWTEPELKGEARGVPPPQ